MGEFNNEINVVASCLRTYATELYQLGSAFETVGNSHVSDHLYHVSDALAGLGEQLRKANFDRVGEETRESVDVTHRLLEAVMAGISMGAKP